MNVTVEKLISKRTTSLMVAIVLLIAGILFCISPAIGEASAGIVIGIGVTLIGIIWAVKDFLVSKELISRGVIIGSLIVALGVYFMADGSIVSKIIGVIPYVLIVTGGCVVADAILLKTVRDKNNDKKFAIELTIGLVAIVLGSLILALGFFRKALAVIIGALLIAGSVYYLIGFFKKSDKPAASKAKKPDAAEKKTESAEAAPAEAVPAKASSTGAKKTQKSKKAQ